MVRFTGANVVVFDNPVGCDVSRAFAHLVLGARAILRRDVADMIRVGWFAL